MSPAGWLLGATSASVFQDPTVNDQNEMQPVHALDELEAQGRMTIDGEADRDRAFSSLERDPYKDDGGES
jgi:hypothetical protein